MNAVFLVLSCSRTSSLLHHRVRDADAETARLVVDATTLVDATTRLVRTNVVKRTSRTTHTHTHTRVVVVVLVLVLHLVKQTTLVGYTTRRNVATRLVGFETSPPPFGFGFGFGSGFAFACSSDGARRTEDEGGKTHRSRANW